MAEIDPVQVGFDSDRVLVTQVDGLLGISVGPFSLHGVSEEGYVLQHCLMNVEDFLRSTRSGNDIDDVPADFAESGQYGTGQDVEQTYLGVGIVLSVAASTRVRLAGGSLDSDMLQSTDLFVSSCC
jgi:hypothetical protein